MRVKLRQKRRETSEENELPNLDVGIVMLPYLMPNDDDSSKRNRLDFPIEYQILPLKDKINLEISSDRQKEI